ncbi:MAG: hypothetical protein ABEN55_01410 [Bradymonadaceae bacterium]
MLRLLFALILVLAAIGAVVYLVLNWWTAPHRRLLRQFRKMRQLIMEGIEESQRPHAQRLLEDCEQHLEGLIRARQRLEVLTDMADAASEYVDADRAVDYDELESRLQDDVSYFLEEMARISAQVDYDWRQSIERLETFTDELEQQHQIVAELDELSDSHTELQTEPQTEPQAETAEK